MSNQIGMRVGEFNVWAVGTGVGKSQFLQEIASASHNVIDFKHITDDSTVVYKNIYQGVENE